MNALMPFLGANPYLALHSSAIAYFRLPGVALVSQHLQMNFNLLLILITFVIMIGPQLAQNHEQSLLLRSKRWIE